MADTQYDVVVFGATGFVGQLLCRVLKERYPEGSGLRWAAAGRSRDRLAQLAESLELPELALLVADATDEKTLKALCRRTRVVASTVGPYAIHGEPLIKACTQTGTDYCDLTGEVQWIRRMIQRYGDTARASGARLVNCCGFDSLPSDLGTLFLQQAARERFNAAATRGTMRVKGIRGGVSGGTVASMVHLAREMRTHPGLRRELADPYSLCPPDKRPTTPQHSVRSARYDAVAKCWIAPFIMAATNERLVHRSNALMNQAYGADFRYDEAMITGAGRKGRLRAYALTAALGGFMLGIALAPTRALLERFALPAPGDGPGPRARADGFYDIRFQGETADGHRIAVRVVGDGDPGYRSTSRMLAEAAACLARDVDTTNPPGGFWTPASIFGARLIERLETYAGVHFEIDE